MYFSFNLTFQWYRVQSLASAGETSKLTRANSTRANITSSTKLNATTTKRADKGLEVSSIDSFFYYYYYYYYYYYFY